MQLAEGQHTLSLTAGAEGVWIPGKGEAELPGTRAGYPNGVLVSPDGRYMYFNAWTAKARARLGK